MHTSEDTCVAARLSRLEVQVGLIVARQDEILALLRKSLAGRSSDKRAAQIHEAIQCLSTIGPNTAAIARHLGIKRTTLDSWEEFCSARDTYRAMEQQAALDRSRNFTDIDTGDDG